VQRILCWVGWHWWVYRVAGGYVHVGQPTERTRHCLCCPRSQVYADGRWFTIDEREMVT
jgi:hypothetical protein